MPLINLHVGTFAAAYVGLSTDTAPLTELIGLTTGAHKITINQPEVFNYSVGNSLQAGPVSVLAGLTFLSDDEQAVILSEGNWLTAATEDTAATYPLLTLLLVHPDPTAESSFLIPLCYAQKNLSLNYEKTTATITPLNFYWQQLNRFTPQIYYKRSPEELAAILGSRSPF